MSPRFASVDDLLADARSRLERLDPPAVIEAREQGALLVDIRPAWQRELTGEIYGALVVERNHLEWRLHPDSDARVPQAAPGQQWIVVCAEGYTSSLAADALNSIGVPATDLAGGVEAWTAAGLPLVVGVTPPNALVHAPSAGSGQADGGQADGGQADGGQADGGQADGGQADGGQADSGPAAGGQARPGS